MTTEEIRQKAIECGKAFATMCDSKETEYGEFFKCHCEYSEVGEDSSCSAVYGYEQGFADGVRDFAEWFLRAFRIFRLWSADDLLVMDVESLVHEYEKQMKGGENE